MTKNTYIEREPIIQFIEHGLNEKKFGYDAIEILGKIQFTPAADVAPVKHGHWEYDKHFRFAECSECEAEFYICDLEEISGDGFINFCPTCGAKMTND